MIWFVVVLAAFNLAISFVMQTNNFQSSMIFKIIPFTLGAGSMLYCLSYFGII